MEIHRYDADGKSVGTMKVPVKLAYKEKVISSILKGNYLNPNAQSDNENILPMISVQWKGMTFDAERARGLRDKRKLYVEYVQDPNVGCIASQVEHIDYQTVPYKLTFDVIFWARYMDDLAQLIENVDPFLHPEIYLSFYEKGVGIERKVKVVKTGESPNFSVDLGETDLRSKVLMWTMNFEMECNLYKPELPVGKPIKRIITRFSASDMMQKDAIALGEVVETQTAHLSGAFTASVSGGCPSYCYSDLDADLVTFIRDYTNVEDILQPQYKSHIDPCAGPPQTLQEPPAVPTPPFPYGSIVTNTTTDTYVITGSELMYNYVPVAYVNSPSITGYDLTVSSITDATTGQFTVKLSQIPPIEGYNIDWYAYQKYRT